jgi:hypothetical protein
LTLQTTIKNQSYSEQGYNKSAEVKKDIESYLPYVICFISLVVASKTVSRNTYSQAYARGN